VTAMIPIFAGPSLWGCELPETFEWRPPARAGDLIGLLDDPPERLCLIDGLFDACAAPWHKELLLLMAAGTRIYGAASMGALRAAELDQFGMTGVGAVYEAYRDGLLDGDDEVALVHGPERWGWKPLTVPMVEVRATLISACRAGLLQHERARLVRRCAHDIHYDRRDWRAIEQECVGRKLLTMSEAQALQLMHVPLKQLDALLCVQAALQHDKADVRPTPPITIFIRELASSQAVASALPQAPRLEG
jgi:hypothetical protein